MRLHRSVLAAAVLFAGSWVQAAELSEASRREVDELLARVGKSGCEFYRGGSWYNAEKARDHLERKYRYLAVRNLLGSAEDFVVMGGTRSSMTNEPYAIRCGSAAAQPSAAWLTEELRTIRQASAKGGPVTPSR
jgi:hypothetical protein